MRCTPSLCGCAGRSCDVVAGRSEGLAGVVSLSVGEEMIILTEGDEASEEEAGEAGADLVSRWGETSDR